MQVACKYVEDPVLFERGDIGKVKFDIRYIVLLRSVQPLKLYAYKVFWLRFANMWVQQKQLTVRLMEMMMMMVACWINKEGS